MSLMKKKMGIKTKKNKKKKKTSLLEKGNNLTLISQNLTLLK